MTGQHGYIVAERVELVFDSLEEQVAVAAGQIPAADTAGKQNVAADQQFIFPQKETETAGAMPGNFENFHLQPEEIASRRRLDQEIGFDRFDLELESGASKKLRIG